MNFIAICSLLLGTCAVSVTSAFCYWNTGCPYKYFSSVSSYNTVRGDIRDSLVKFNGCEPSSIWGLYRHGKKYPTADLASKLKKALVIRDYIITSYSKGKSSLCAQDVDNLRDWSIDNNMFERANELTDEGRKEFVGIGRRLKQAFPKLLANINDGSYTVGAASATWIKDSAESFIAGLKKGLTIKQVNDNIVPAYENCNQYLNEVKNNPKTYIEIDKYMTTSDYLAVKDRIQRRLGVEYTLTNDNITSLYELCRYVWSGDIKLSPWCALFTTQDLQVLEYIGDLRSYYESGYGSPMNELFGRITLKDLLKSFQEAKDGKGKKLTSYFTDASTLDMVYTALGIFKDKSPLNSTLRDPERKWRSSKTSILSGNLVAVLYSCIKDGIEDNIVVLYVNEEPIRSICGSGLCSWTELEDKLNSLANTTIDFCGFQLL